MSLGRSWQFVGGPGSSPYRLFDWTRRRLNVRLVGFLSNYLPCSRAGSDTSSAPKARVLEAGSGTAFASSLFRRNQSVKTCVCLDIDQDALIEATRRDAGLRAVVGDMRRMPFVSGAFSLVFNSSTVEHLDEPEKAVREMRRVCESDGRVFVGVPYSRGPLGFQPLVRNTLAGRWLGPVFSRKSLHALLRAAGLTPISSVRYFWNFFVGAVATKAVTAAGDKVEGGR